MQQSISIRPDPAEKRICDVEDKSFEIVIREQREKNKKDEESLHELWVILKRNVYAVSGSQKKEEREKGAASLFRKIMAENFPHLGRDLDIQAH